MLSHNVNPYIYLENNTITLIFWFFWFLFNGHISVVLYYVWTCYNEQFIYFIYFIIFESKFAAFPSLRGRRKKGRERGREKSTPLPFSLLFPYPLPLSTPAKLFPKIGTHFSPQRSRLYTSWPYFEERLKKQGNKSNLALSAFPLVASCKGV